MDGSYRQLFTEAADKQELFFGTVEGMFLYHVTHMLLNCLPFGILNTRLISVSLVYQI